MTTSDPSASAAPAATDAAASVAAANARKLAAWERQSVPAILAAAIIPLIAITTGPQNRGFSGVAIEIVSWLVFVVDFVLHVRWQPKYLRTRLGQFDLAVVLLTSPWFLLPGVGGGEIVSLLRLARLARVLVIGFKTPMVARTLKRLGRPFLYVSIATMVAAEIVVRAEHHEHGFKTYGDSLWWAVVTITTVGYGDLVPESTVGRVTATLLMLVGVGMLGTVAASLASLFRLEDNADGASDDSSAAPARGLVAEIEHDIAEEMRALRHEVHALRVRLGDAVEHRHADDGSDQTNS